MDNQSSYDDDWINFDYLRANNVNINFHRNIEWKCSLPLDELASLEEELFFDKHLNLHEKSVVLKANKDSSKPEPNCRYCLKEFKFLGKSLFNHQAKCFLNPRVAKNLSVSTFKNQVLRANGACPKCCLQFSSKLIKHANFCFASVTDFSKFLPIPESLKNKIKIIALQLQRY